MEQNVIEGLSELNKYKEEDLIEEFESYSDNNSVKSCDSRSSVKRKTKTKKIVRKRKESKIEEKMSGKNNEKNETTETVVCTQTFELLKNFFKGKIDEFNETNEEYFKNIQKQNEDLKKTYKQTMEEKMFNMEMELKTFMGKKIEEEVNTKWGQERERVKAAEEKIKDMEKYIEKKQKQEKKNNIIIVGFEKEGNMENVQKFITEEIKVVAEIEEVWKLNDKTVGVKIRNFNDKLEILKKRGALKGTTIYINEDYTAKEAKIQKEIKNKIKEEKSNNNKGKVTLGYKKASVGEKCFAWNDEKNKVIEVKENSNKFFREKRG